MTYFPLFIASENRNCLVVGGGQVALQKLKVLISGEFNIKVVAPEILPEIKSLPVEMYLRKVAENDLDGVQMVVDATGDLTIGNWLFKVCTQRQIALNVVDCPDLCNFIFPAMLRRGKLTAAISSAGASPVAAVWVRDQLDEMLPDCFEEILLQMDSLRPLTRQRIQTQKQRAAFLKTCFTSAMKKGRALSKEELERLWPHIS